MLKKCIKCLIIISIVFTIIIWNNIALVLAISQSDLDKVNSNIDEKEKEIEQVERNLSSAMKEIQTLTSQISEYETEISDLNYQIDEVSAKIEQKEKELAEAEENFNYQQNLLELRIVAMYEAGKTTYLDVLLSSKSITDFISKFYIVSEIAESDNMLLKQIEADKIAIEETKNALDVSKQQIETLKKNKEETARALKNSQSVKQSYVDDLNDEEKSLQAELDQFEKDKQAIQAELERIARESNGGKIIVPGEPSEAGYIFPVQGLNIYNINVRSYPSYPGHTGVDININVKGRNVIAAKAGTVITSTALRYANGNYRSYGEYVVIDHHDGTMTLYAHMSPNSRTVSVGDEVAQGQVLGIVGTTGNSTGLHLHFEVRINGKPVNPLPYLQ